jgi:hypothetical protein
MCVTNLYKTPRSFHNKVFTILWKFCENNDFFISIIIFVKSFFSKKFLKKKSLREQKQL